MKRENDHHSWGDIPDRKAISSPLQPLILPFAINRMIMSPPGKPILRMALTQ
ncbi:hypothetical protein ACTHRH_22675 [Paenibacillus sp. SAFN-117]